MDNQNLIRFHGSFEDFAKAYEGQILRYLIYRRMFTPREQEEKYIDESVYEDTHMNTGILREVTRLPDNDYLLGFAVVAEDYAEGINLECGVEYVKLSEIRLYYYPVDAERYGANEYNGTEQ